MTIAEFITKHKITMTSIKDKNTYDICKATANKFKEFLGTDSFNELSACESE